VIHDNPAPTGVDTNTPNVARVWDYQLGGKDNFGADRAAADALNEACHRVGAPDGHVVARENRDFIDRAVRYLAGPAGIRQFIDIGAGRTWTSVPPGAGRHRGRSTAANGNR